MSMSWTLIGKHMLSGTAGEAGRGVSADRTRATAMSEGWHGVPGTCSNCDGGWIFIGRSSTCKNTRSY